MKIMVVDDMANMPPKNRLFILDHPKAWPAMEPIPIMQNMMVQAAINGELPIFSIFLKLNSSPNVNIRKITPMSAQVLILAGSETDGVKLKCGPQMKPATI